MTKGRAMKKKRPQGRKRGVEIPPSPELAEHADRIRALGRQTFDGVIEIGERLVRCRELLKAQRVWLAWLKAEFGWSRAHADNLIAVYVNRRKLLNFSSLPISALYLLARASPEAVDGIARRAKAGHRISLAEIAQRTRAKRADPEPAAITMNATPSLADNGPRRMFGSVASSETPPWTSAKLHRAHVEYQIKEFLQDAARIARFEEAYEHGTEVAAEQFETANKIVREARAVLDTFLRGLESRGGPRDVHQSGDDGDGSTGAVGGEGSAE